MKFNFFISLLLHIFLLAAVFVSFPASHHKVSVDLPSVSVQFIPEEATKKDEPPVSTSIEKELPNDVLDEQDREEKKAVLPIEDASVVETSSEPKPLLEEKPKILENSEKSVAAPKLPLSVIEKVPPISKEPLDGGAVAPDLVKEEKFDSVADILPSTAPSSLLRASQKQEKGEKKLDPSPIELPTTAPLPSLPSDFFLKAKVEKKEKDAKKEKNQNILDERITDLLKNKKSSNKALEKETNKNKSSLTQHSSSHMGEKLSENEMDLLREKIQACWNVTSLDMDSQKRVVSIQFKLTPEGEVVDGSLKIASGAQEGFDRPLVESARRAILRCAPYKLPIEKYSAWEEVTVNFDPSGML